MAREGFLADACADDTELRRRVDELLRADAAAEGFLSDSSGLDATGSIIGRYRLTERIGEGGGGVVYRAENIEEDLPPVALKVVKPGMDTEQVLGRFELERRSLARMDHPGIARVFDAGVTSAGRPFFVMELVDGRPLTDFAEARGLTVPERLELFRDVCRAVQHAHQKGIIHRDLKPSNVLVTEVDGRPAPKVIDFGIAKAITEDSDLATDLTQQRLFMGTPQYMSPEQAGIDDLDVDVRADIYSLGVLLFELLTGNTPLDPRELREVGVGGFQRLVDAAVTPRPSRVAPPHLAKLLEQDLDWVVLMALERDRDRRYASVEQLADDVRRVLDVEPVLASPPSGTYRMRKFVRRNRLAVGASAALLLMLVIAVVGTTIGYVEARAANRQLEQVLTYEQRRIASIDLSGMGTTTRDALIDRTRRGLLAAKWPAEEVTERIAALEKLIASTNFTSVAMDVTLAELIDPADEAIDAEFAGQPVRQAQIRYTLAKTADTLGLLSHAADLAQRALEVQRDAFGDGHEETLDTIALLASLLRRLNRVDEASPLQDEIVRAWERFHGANSAHALAARIDQATLWTAQGKWDAVEVAYEDLLSRTERHLGPHDSTTLAVINNYAGFVEGRGRIEEAAELYRRAADGHRGRRPHEVLNASSNLSRMLGMLGRNDEAEALARSVLIEMRRALGDDHTNTLAAMNTLAGILFNKGDVESALPLVEEAAAGQARTLGAAHPRTIAAVASLAVVLGDAGRIEEAVLKISEALELARDVFPPGDPILGRLLAEKERLLEASDRFSEVEESSP